MTLWPVYLKYANLLSYLSFSSYFHWSLHSSWWCKSQRYSGLWPCLLPFGTVLGKVRENFLLNLWSLPISAVIRAAQQWRNCQHKDGKIKWSCECMSLPNMLRVCWVKEEHDPQARRPSRSTCPFFTCVLLWNLCLLLLPGEVPKGSSSPRLTHALLTLISPTSAGDNCSLIVLGIGDTLFQVACRQRLQMELGRPWRNGLNMELFYQKRLQVGFWFHWFWLFQQRC